MKCPNCESAVRAVISKQLGQNLPHIMLKPNRLVGVVGRDIVIGAGRGGSRGGRHIPPPAIFKHDFDKYSFFIISNLFDNTKPYALRTHNRKCTNKCITFGETLRFRGKKFKQNLLKNCLTSAKMTTPVYKFSKNFQGSMSPDPLRVFFILNMLQNNSAEKKHA